MVKKGQNWLAPKILVTIIIAILIGLTVLYFVYKIRGALA
jgi:hypothetical protein